MISLKIFLTSTILIFLGLLTVDRVCSEERKESFLEEIVIRGERIVTPTKQAAETVYTGSEINRKGLELSGERGKTNVFESISILPGIVFESADSNNLVTDQVNIRIRGVRAIPATGITVEGLPNTIGPPRHYIYDFENVESLAVYKGAIPLDFGTGVGNRGGAIELKPAWASDKIGLRLSQSVGSFEYRRTFLRFDSGIISPTDSRFSVSFSNTAQSKWKGNGEIGPRNNLNLTFIQPLGSFLELRIWGNYNDIELHKYRPLTYPQVMNLRENYRTDYTGRITGIASQDYLYYDFNKESRRDRDIFVVTTIKPDKNVKILIKPYVSASDATIWDGREGGTVQKQSRDIERYGAQAELEAEILGIKAKLGYLYERTDMSVRVETFNIKGNGSLEYRGFAVHEASPSPQTVNSPYLKISGSIGKFNWQAGIKYFRYEESSVEGYLTQIVNNVPLLVRASDLDRTEKSRSIWLPSAGVSYNFADNLESYISYGKTFRRPYQYIPIINQYALQRQRFQAAGVRLQDIFDGLDFERSDNVDIGIRYSSELFEINPVIFLSRHRNLLTTVSDPRVRTQAGTPINYPQNIGKSKGYGLELGTNIFITDGISLYFNPTYTVLEYDSDITWQGRTLATKGKQVLDVPRWSLVSGAIIKYSDFEIVPQFRFLSKRFGDCEHNEIISSSTIFDLKLSYKREKLGLLRDVKVALEIDNLFNKKYVSVINAFDDSVSGRTTYFPGAPFAVKGSLTFTF